MLDTAKILHDIQKLNLELRLRSERCWQKFPTDFRNKYKLATADPKQYLNAILIKIKNKSNGAEADFSIPLYLFSDLNHPDWSYWSQQSTRALVNPDAEKQSIAIVDVLLRNPDAFQALTQLNMSMDTIEKFHTTQNWLYFQEDLQKLIQGNINKYNFLEQWGSK